MTLSLFVEFEVVIVSAMNTYLNLHITLLSLVDSSHPLFHSAQVSPLHHSVSFLAGLHCDVSLNSQILFCSRLPTRLIHAQFIQKSSTTKLKREVRPNS